MAFIAIDRTGCLEVVRSNATVQAKAQHNGAETSGLLPDEVIQSAAEGPRWKLLHSEGPRNGPPLVFRFCNITPLISSAPFKAGTVTLPATNPVAGDTVAVSVLSAFLILQFSRIIASLVNGALRLPPLKTAMPMEWLKTEAPEVNR